MYLDLSEINFAIIVPFARRSNDPEFLLLIHQCVYSVKRQSFQNWTLVLVGDGLIAADFEKVNKKLKSIIPQDKLISLNMNESKKEENVLKGLDLSKFNCNLWCFGGSNALNEGLDYVARNLSFITHVAITCDDDKWKETHLEYLANAYNIDRSVGFANSRVIFSDDHSHFFPGLNEEERKSHFSYRAPVASRQHISSTSWSFLIPELRVLRFRGPLEQFASKRSNSSICCDGGFCGLIPCRTGLVMANDADMWERINRLIVDEKFKSIIVHHITVEVLSNNKEPLLNKLYNKQYN